MVDVAQLVRAPVCGTGGRGFESHYPPHMFEWVGSSVEEHLTFNPRVEGSSPSRPTRSLAGEALFFSSIFLYYCSRKFSQMWRK